MHEFDQSLPMLLYRALNVVMPRFRELFSEYGLTEQQWRVLRVLWDGDSIAQNELTERTLILAPSLVGILNRLEAQGLVTRTRSTTDKRQVHVALTRQGKSLGKRIAPALEAIHKEIDATMTASTRRGIYACLNELAQTKTGEHA